MFFCVNKIIFYREISNLYFPDLIEQITNHQSCFLFAHMCYALVEITSSLLGLVGFLNQLYKKISLLCSNHLFFGILSCFTLRHWRSFVLEWDFSNSDKVRDSTIGRSCLRSSTNIILEMIKISLLATTTCRCFNISSKISTRSNGEVINQCIIFFDTLFSNHFCIDSQRQSYLTISFFVDISFSVNHNGITFIE